MNFTNSLGRLLTRGLFWETAPDERVYAIYTITDKDKHILCNDPVGVKTYPSLYRLYMECADPTEYEFAKAHLAGWQHWLMISNSSWFKEYADIWREELEIRIRSQAVRQIELEARTGGKNTFQASKYLADAGWAPRGSKINPVGRPTQERIKKEAERLNQLELDIIDDHQRLN